MTKTADQLEPGDRIVREGDELTVAYVTSLSTYVREIEVQGHGRLASFVASFDDEFEVVA